MQKDLFGNVIPEKEDKKRGKEEETDLLDEGELEEEKYGEGDYDEDEGDQEEEEPEDEE